MSRPGRPLFRDVSLTVHDGDRIGIVGLNGGGKSTLARVLVGGETPESGVVRRGRDVRISFLDQRSPLPAGTVADALGPGWQTAAIADRLGLTPLLGAATASLSGGEAKRVALARCLVTECELLVLDEPTNHLDIDAIAWLEEHLAAYRGGLVLITHDRFVLDRVTTRILELDRGKAFVHDGGYAGYLEARAAREDAAVSAEATRRNLARRELAWLRRGAPARTTKQKARVERAAALVQTRAEAPARAEALDLEVGGEAGGTPRLGDLVIELHGLGHRHPGQPSLFEGLDLALGRRERLGIVGANGTGKTTALDIIAGRLAPAEGRVVTGTTVRLGYYDQQGAALDGSQRVRDAVARGKREIDWRDARLMERFWFDGDAQWAPIELLSGGEQRRLQLLLVLLERPNVLLLDEPTNDLDLDTLRVLEDFLDDWPGALVVVSHDRAFLERTVDDVVVLERGRPPGRVPGGLASWIESRVTARRAGSTKARRDEPASRSAGGAPAGGPATGAAASPSSSTLKHRMKQAEKAMSPLERRRDRLGEELADPALDHARRVAVAAELAEVAAAIEVLEEQWLEAASLLDGG